MYQVYALEVHRALDPGVTGSYEFSDMGSGN